MDMNRRTLAKGAAWAAPAVVASAAVPAYAASRECGTSSFTAPLPTDENGSTTSWTVPAGVNLICFSVLGAAGGGRSATTPGGAGAQLTGKLPVTPGDTLTLVVGSGGIANTNRIYPATGGKGYGNGGDSVGTPAPSESNVGNTVIAYAGSGGAGSAILLNGQPVVIAGGGGGMGQFNTGYFSPDGYLWNGKRANNSAGHPLATVQTGRQIAGSAGGSSIDVSSSYSLKTTNNAAILDEKITIDGQAAGAVAGRGGAAASNSYTYDGSSIDESFVTTAGESGASASAPGPANGGNGQSQFLAYHLAGDPKYPGMLTRTWYGHTTGGGGGGGYGGGAAGGASIFYGGFDQLVSPQNAQGEPDASGRTIDGRLILGTMYVVGMAGAAGGSYLAPQVLAGQIQEGGNRNTAFDTRNHGAISFTF